MLFLLFITAPIDGIDSQILAMPLLKDVQKLGPMGLGRHYLYRLTIWDRHVHHCLWPAIWLLWIGQAGASTEGEVDATCVQFGSRGKTPPRRHIRCVIVQVIDAWDYLILYNYDVASAVVSVTAWQLLSTMDWNEVARHWNSRSSSWSEAVAWSLRRTLPTEYSSSNQMFGDSDWDATACNA